MNCLYWRAHRTGHFLHQPGGDNSTARLDQEVSKNPKQEIELALKRKKEQEKYDR